MRFFRREILAGYGTGWCDGWVLELSSFSEYKLIEEVGGKQKMGRWGRIFIEIHPGGSLGVTGCKIAREYVISVYTRNSYTWNEFQR
jgi:hypothetical protein